MQIHNNYTFFTIYFVFISLKIIEMKFMEITESRDNFTVYIAIESLKS